MTIRANRKRNRKAFTLTEVLVTMTIVGILLGITLTNVGTLVELVRVLGCRSNLRNIGTAIQMYRQEKHDSVALPPLINSAGNKNWFMVIMPHLSLEMPYEVGDNRLQFVPMEVLQCGGDAMLPRIDASGEQYLDGCSYAVNEKYFVRADEVPANTSSGDPANLVLITDAPAWQGSDPPNGMGGGDGIAQNRTWHQVTNESDLTFSDLNQQVASPIADADPTTEGNDPYTIRACPNHESTFVFVNGNAKTNDLRRETINWSLMKPDGKDDGDDDGDPGA